MPRLRNKVVSPSPEQEISHDAESLTVVAKEEVMDHDLANETQSYPDPLDTAIQRRQPVFEEAIQVRVRYDDSNQIIKTTEDDYLRIDSITDDYRPMISIEETNDSIDDDKMETFGDDDILGESLRYDADLHKIKNELVEAPDKKLMVFQIPAALPVLVPADETPNIVKQEPNVFAMPGSSNHGAGGANKSLLQPNSMDNFMGPILNLTEDGDDDNDAFPPPDGQIGELVIHESGRTFLYYGSMKMEITAGAECSFLQDITVIHTEGDMKAWSLGNINRRFVGVPDLSGVQVDY